MKKLALLLALVFPLEAFADTPPILNVLKLKAGTTASPQTGILKADGGTISTLPPGANGNVATSNGTTWVSTPPPASGISALTGDVSATGPGSASATVNSVGGSSASNIHAAEILANAASQLNIINTIVRRDASGNFAAGTITAALTGHASADEPAISSGLSTQYWAGDKAWHLLDTSVVPENGNLYWTQARFDSAFGSKSTTNLLEGSNLYWTQARFDSAFGAKSTTNLVEGLNLYCTQARFDTAFGLKSTTNLAEGSNLYFTNARVDSEFDTRLATKTTSNLAEGSNLYYTQGRFDTAFAAKSTSNLTEGSNLYYTNGRVDTEFDTRLATKTTSNLAEGSNLYYTDTRVQAAAKSGISLQELWVSKSVGDDTFDGSLLHPFKTIGVAVTAANAISSYYKQTIIHIEPINNGGSAGGNYNENVTLSQQGVNLLCDLSGPYTRPCTVGGTLTVNLSGTSGGTNFIAASNEVVVSGLTFTSGASTTVTFSGTAFQRLIAVGCYFQASAAHTVVETNTGLSGSTPSEFRSYDTTFENNSSTLETVTLTAGRFWTYGTTATIQNNNAAGPSVLQNGPSSMIANITQFTGQYQLTDNTATATFNLSTIASGSNSCIVTPSSPSTGYALISYFGCNSTATNSITGSGIVVDGPGNARFGSSGDIISTVTQLVLGPGLPQGEMMLGAGATTGTNVLLSIKDGHVKLAQTTAPTTTLSGNAGTGGTPACTLTHASDHAGFLSLKTGTASWATGTQCTINFNKAWTTVPVCTMTASNDAAKVAENTQRIVMPDATTSAQTISAGVAFSSQVTATWHYQCWETQ